MSVRLTSQPGYSSLLLSATLVESQGQAGAYQFFIPVVGESHCFVYQCSLADVDSRGHFAYTQS